MSELPGSWPSPITVEQAVAAGRSPDAVAFAGNEVWWSEGRPTEGGRTVICRVRDGAVEDLIPPTANARNRVHEYGGTSWVVVPGEQGPALVFAEFTDQRLYLVDPIGSEPVAVTEEPSRPAGLRYADFHLDAPRRRLLAVREKHVGDGTFGTVRRTVVAIPLDGSGQVVDVLDGGPTGDFLAAPRLSPSGDMLLWVSWNHPDMPWDTTRVHLVRLDRDGLATGRTRTIAGGEGISVVDPGFLSDGSVLVMSDESDWWQPILVDPNTDATRSLSSAEVEFARPLWQLGRRSWAPLPGGRLLVTPGGSPAVLDTLDQSLSPLDPIWAVCGDLATTADGRMAMVVGGPRLGTTVVVVEPDGRRRQLRTSSEESWPAGYLPEPDHRQIGGGARRCLSTDQS